MSLLTDREHLPSVVTNIDGIRDVLDAISPEIEQLIEQIQQTLRELFAQSTEFEIKRWEEDLGLKFDATLTLDDRRLNILNKLQNNNVLNWDNLNKLIKQNIEDVPFYVTNNSVNYSFKISVATPNISQLDKAIKQAKPAYLTYTIEVVDIYVRRCGTFACGTNPL